MDTKLKARLRLLGHMQTRDQESRRKRGRQKRGFRDAVEDMLAAAVTERVVNRVTRRQALP